MSQNLFSKLVKEYFEYLIDEYNFELYSDRYSPEMMGNAEIVYKTPKTGFSIVLDRSQVLANIGPTELSRGDWFEFSDVVKYFSPNTKTTYLFPDDFSDYKQINSRRKTASCVFWA